MIKVRNIVIYKVLYDSKTVSCTQELVKIRRFDDFEHLLAMLTVKCITSLAKLGGEAVNYFVLLGMRSLIFQPLKAIFGLS